MPLFASRFSATFCLFLCGSGVFLSTLWPQPASAQIRQGFRPLPIERIDGRAPHGLLATVDSIQANRVLEARSGRPAEMNRPAGRTNQYWVVLPVGRGLVRLQLVDDGSLWSLAATGPAGAAVLALTTRDADQLWRVVPYGDSVRLDSVAYPGRSLAGSADGLVAIERTSGGPAQRWIADFGPPPPSLPLPAVRLTTHEIIPNPDLPPAVVTLRNTHHEDLLVLVGDLRPTEPSRQFRIPAGGAARVRLARDAGATIRERYEVRSPAGVLASEEYVTSIPPNTLYDISVYEMFLQSIAIDRTGKSPHPIEDINYQPKSVGIFPVPAGPRLPREATIDVWEEARRADNPGGVRPLDRKERPEERIDPLNRLLEEVTRE